MKIIAILGYVLALSGCKDLDITKLPIPTSPPVGLPTAISASTQISCPTSASNIEWEVHFSPNGGAEEFIADNIRHISESVYLQGYSFTSIIIAEALVIDQQHNKTTEVVLDKSDLTAKGSVIKMLLDGRVPVYIDNKHSIAHNKIVLIDKMVTFTGSFNFTRAAEHANAENSIRLINTDIYQVYKQNYDLHRSHSYRLEHL